MNTKNIYVRLNIKLLRQGIEVLNNIDDRVYIHSNPQLYKSNIGKHFRHIIDYYSNLLEGRNNKIDYDERKRNSDIESNRITAIQKMRVIIDKLGQLETSEFSINREILIKSNYEGTGEESAWSNSSIKRELEFLVSHTVHHYALIDMILNLNQVNTPEAFGIAPSTLRYLKEKDEEY